MSGSELLSREQKIRTIDAAGLLRDARHVACGQISGSELLWCRQRAKRTFQQFLGLLVQRAQVLRLFSGHTGGMERAVPIHNTRTCAA